ncbi:ABC transporter ATP-binding protein [Magnetospirillum sulfuroxidans]|uniref:ABC transporter ATP-binding protein n=1 Tax=Magnetospirillum sulfuroxidans TaxID=611300 RepID=A0ABS5IAC0_9PROT|nr:ABC transporter ATP-binding protein [Magnetospirillum sulfuroxidans]MBR9971372.1 ABC transporter ATP-binding protein [Magnetospirillum sulfuroxidans]
MIDAAIHVEKLSKSFAGQPAVDAISFSVATGSTTALLGGNGAGKTTTISMLLGLLLPDSGTIRVLGEDMVKHRYRVLPRVNFSSPYVELPHRLSVRENLTVYGHLYGVSKLKQRIAQLAEELELIDFLDRASGRLSAGQKTRVAIAKAMLNQPELLLLDEPTASLDPDTADWVRGYFRAYQQRSGATILLASHNMAEVERLCDQVVMMKQGGIVDAGSPAQLRERYGRNDLEQVFLDIARNRRLPHGAA